MGVPFKFSALFEFLVSGYELTSTGTMKEGTIPVLLYCPFAYSDDDGLPLLGIIAFSGSGAQSGWDETTGSVHVLLNMYTEPDSLV
jgi:hypothetical protein